MKNLTNSSEKFPHQKLNFKLTFLHLFSHTDNTVRIFSKDGGVSYFHVRKRKCLREPWANLFSRYFVQWLVHESDATWDFVWTVFLTSKITVNLVHLASVNRWSRRQLRKFFQQKYAKFRRELNKYRKVTAWYVC